MLAAFDVMGDISPVSATATGPTTPPPEATGQPSGQPPPRKNSLLNNLNGHANGSAPTSPTRANGNLNGAPLNGNLNGAPKKLSNTDNPMAMHNNNNNNHFQLANNKKSHMLTKQQTQAVFPRRVAVNLQFTNITCHMTSIEILRRRVTRKQILHGVSGEFRSGELTAIMGPSGAGKSTLLNILAGFNGLDSSSTTQCVSLLKSLAREGRTVVCTIHQPSALLFGMFDQLYSVAAGRCVYQGDTKGLVPYLAQQGLPCPPYHNPADFLMEVSSGDFGITVEALSDAAAKNSSRQPVVFSGNTLKLEDELTCPPPPAPLFMQFYLLFMRNIIVMRRDWSSLFLRVFMHIFIGLVFGYLYRGVGSNADDVLANVVYLYGSNLFLVYTGQMAVTLAFPIEVEMLTREHFNRWYSLAPYLLSVVLVELPLQAMLCATYVAPSFLLTEQPLDLVRMVHFYTFATLASLTAQSCGFLFGATTPITISVFLGPVVAVLLSIFGFCIWYKDIPYIFKWMYYISYFRAAFQGCLYAMYALGRDLMPCPEGILYCHYRTPRKILNEMGITDINFWNNSATIIAFCAIVYVLTVIRIWFKLNRR